MKFIIFLFLATAISAFAFANETTGSEENTKKATQPKNDVTKIISHINNKETKGTTKVNVSPEIVRVLNKSFETTKVADGFRIQIYSSNRGSEARKTAFEIEQKIKEIDQNVKVYVTYESPFWKVRLGNCSTRDEAIKFRLAVIKKFPDFSAETYIVPSEIEINQ